MGVTSTQERLIARMLDAISALKALVVRNAYQKMTARCWIAAGNAATRQPLSKQCMDALVNATAVCTTAHRQQKHLNACQKIQKTCWIRAGRAVFAPPSGSSSSELILNNHYI